MEKIPYQIKDSSLSGLLLAMKLNGMTRIDGSSVVLVPYRKTHVEKYHRWMESSELRELTASERLSLEEEYKMQQSWFEDDDKLTFIILDRMTFIETGSEIEAMIGDTNLFLVDAEDRTLAEGEIMVAEEAFRGQRRGWEAMLLIFRYGVQILGIKRYQVKIGLGNIASIKMFTKMRFLETSRSEAFQEVTLEVEVTQDWITWLHDNTISYSTLAYDNPNDQLNIL